MELEQQLKLQQQQEQKNIQLATSAKPIQQTSTAQTVNDEVMDLINKPSPEF